MQSLEFYQFLKPMGVGYILVAIFLLVFISLTWQKTGSIHEDLKEPYWASLIALILVLPIILVPVLKYVWPRLTSIKISNVIELSLTPEPTENLANLIVNSVNPDTLSGVDYASQMTSGSKSILDKAKELQESRRKSALVINLVKGHSWIPPNLYFLAFTVERLRLIDQIVFVKETTKLNEFIAMCSPAELLLGLDSKFPDYLQAKKEVENQQPSLYQSGDVFFSTLTKIWQQKGDSEGSHKIWLNAGNLVIIVGGYLHTEHVEEKEKLDDFDYRYILKSQYPYIAIVKHKEFRGIVNQGDLALKIARLAMGVE